LNHWIIIGYIRRKFYAMGIVKERFNEQENEKEETEEKFPLGARGSRGCIASSLMDQWFNTVRDKWNALPLPVGGR
jgi:hypothetical protein